MSVNHHNQSDHRNNYKAMTIKFVSHVHNDLKKVICKGSRSNWHVLFYSQVIILALYLCIDAGKPFWLNTRLLRFQSFLWLILHCLIYCAICLGISIGNISYILHWIWKIFHCFISFLSLSLCHYAYDIFLHLTWFSRSYKVGR